MVLDLKWYYETLSKEIFSKYNRLRKLVNHYGEDWKYKEVIIKKMIQTFLPEEYWIGTGFVATRWLSLENNYSVSSQIDLIIYKKSYPFLFKEEDFVIVIPNAVRGIIEVKSNLKNELDAIDKANNLWRTIIQQQGNLSYWIFNGIFSFEWFLTLKQPLSKLLGTVNHIVLNEKYFIKNFWSIDTEEDIRYYELKDLTVAYFIQNLISYITKLDGIEQRQEQALWYPIDKELTRLFANNIL